MDEAKQAAAAKFTVDLSGLELSDAERVQLSAAILRSAVTEIAKLSLDKGKGLSLDLGTRFDPRIDGGRVLAKLQRP